MKKLIFTLTLILLCNIGFSQNTIDPVLQDVLNKKSDEMIDINIVFKSQIDLNKLRNSSRHFTDKETRRNVLVDELKIFSEEKQQEVMSILQAETKSYKVTNIKSHWLSNSISCTVHRDVIYLLAKHHDIELIGYDEMKQMIFEEGQQTTDNGQQSVRDDELYVTDNVTMVNADKVWKLGYTGKGIVVAVIDSGVNYNHADLADHLWDGGAEFPNHGYDIISDDNDPMDQTGHGTHCAGTICGDGTSGVHTGVAPDATLMCIRVLDEYGFGSASSFTSGMEFAVEHHADILSMSLGIMNASATDKTMLRNTCVNALELGVIASVAAGNDGNMMMAPVPNNVRTPGNCPPPWLHPDQQVNPGALSCVVCVGAVDLDKKMYENGSKGPVTWTDTQFGDYPYNNSSIGLIRPDVCAPGVGVKSLDYNTNDGYNLKTGTSMATPCVAGVMALMLEKQNDLTPAEICMLLETTAERLTETKSNLHGSGLVNAFEAVSNIKKGDLTYNSFSINDSEYNDNDNLNAGEKVKMSVIIKNQSETSYNNIKVVMTCNNDMVEITDSEATVDVIAANDEIILTDEFEFSVDENVIYTTPLLFDFNLYDENENIVSSFSIVLYTSNNELTFSSFIVKNDDNDNGILDAGETADLGVILNNIGNEMAVQVNGTLKCSSDIININESEASFSSIGDKSSGIAFFKVKVADNADDGLNIPLELSTTDVYGNEKHFSFNYINQCNYIFELTDYYYDGWDGAMLLVKYDNDRPTDSLTIVDGGYLTHTISIKSNVEVTLEWIAGKYDAECGFNIYTDDGILVYTSPEFPNRNMFLYSWVNDCSCANEYQGMCDAVQDLTGTQNGNKIELTWSTTDSQQPTTFEIYRETKLLATTEDATFIDETISEKGDYIYSVRAIYHADSDSDCVGLFSDVTVTYTPEMISENISARASVYPNPSKDNFTINCENMTKVTIYNIVGNKIIETEINDNNYIISDLESGVYFVDIKTTENNIVKRIVKI